MVRIATLFLEYITHTQPTTPQTLREQWVMWRRRREQVEYKLRMPTRVEKLTYSPRPGMLADAIPLAFESQQDLPIRDWWATEFSWLTLVLACACAIGLLQCAAAYPLLLPILIIRACKQLNLRCRRVGTIHMVCVGLTAMSDCLGIWECYYYIMLVCNVYYTRYWNSLDVELPLLPTIQSGEIRRMVIHATRPVTSSHSHPLLAAARNAADDTMDTFIYGLGLQPYSIQLSKRDIERGIPGVLSPLWHCDSHAPPRCDPIPDQAVIRMTNVDYYVDWNDYLWMCRPIMIHTFTPADPCGSFQESQWTVGSDNVVTMRVAGGGVYRHRLWDYDVESFDANYPGMTIQYSVTKVPVNKHWSIVTMVPTHRKPNILLSDAPSHTLKRAVFCHQVLTMDGTIRWSATIQRQGVDAVMSLGIPGEYVSLEIPAMMRTILSARIRLAKLAIHDLIVILAPTYGDDVRFAQALIFSAYPVENTDVWMRHTPWNARDAAVTYRRVARPQLMPREKIVARVIAAPILDSAFVPAKTYMNDVWTVAERITAVANPQAELDPEYSLYASEFAVLFLPRAGCLAPREVSEVIESQKRPAQVRSNTAAAPGLAGWLAKSRTTIRSFQKAEVYSSIKDPRNISTLPTEHCLEYSTFTQAMAAHIKQFDWYAFGMHPDAVAQRVHSIAANCHHLVETDFSRFDGTHSTALYEFELMLLLRAFPESHHPMIKRVHNVMTTSTAATAQGVKYDIGGSRLSGSADTSLMNTVDNAYVAYCVFRRMRMTSKEAWKMLGIYGGDDGITPDADAKSYERVSADLGLRLKARATAPSAPCSFLGRIYPCASASAGHMCDLPRQLAKLHVFPGQDITATKETILYNRATGYLVTDPNTPIISEWCRLVLRSITGGKVNRLDLRSWDSLLAPEWCAALSRHEMEVQACRMLGITQVDLDAYVLMLRTAVSVDNITPLMVPVAPAIVPGVIVGNDLHVAPGSDHKRAPTPSVIEEEKPLVPDAPIAESLPEKKTSVIPVMPKPAPVTLVGHPYGGKFKGWSRDHLQALRLDDEALYSMTPIDLADQVYRAVLARYPRITAAVDMTAGGGGDTIALARHIDVTSMEVNHGRHLQLQHNVAVARDVYPTLRKVTTMCADSAPTLRALPLDCKVPKLIVVDPPWGGPMRDRATTVDLKFNGKPLTYIVQQALNRPDTAVVLLKLPPEYDIKTLIMPGTEMTGVFTASVLFVTISLLRSEVPLKKVYGLSTWKVVKGGWAELVDTPKIPGRGHTTDSRKPTRVPIAKVKRPPPAK